MIPIPGFMYKISFLKKWENLHHYLTFLKGLSLESYSLISLYYCWLVQQPGINHITCGRFLLSFLFFCLAFKAKTLFISELSQVYDSQIPCRDYKDSVFHMKMEGRVGLQYSDSFPSSDDMTKIQQYTITNITHFIYFCTCNIWYMQHFEIIFCL